MVSKMHRMPRICSFTFRKVVTNQIALLWEMTHQDKGVCVRVCVCVCVCVSYGSSRPCVRDVMRLRSKSRHMCCSDAATHMHHFLKSSVLQSVALQRRRDLEHKAQSLLFVSCRLCCELAPPQTSSCSCAFVCAPARACACMRERARKNK